MDTREQWIRARATEMRKAIELWDRNDSRQEIAEAYLSDIIADYDRHRGKWAWSKAFDDLRKRDEQGRVML